MSTQTSAVLLLRSPTANTDSKPDKYISVFSKREIHAENVPVLEHSFVEVARLRELIANGPSNRFSGVIVTSGRAAEAWSNAAESIDVSDASDFGQKTADTLMGPAPTRPAFYPSPGYLLGAAETGSGEKLARFIIDHFSKQPDRPSSPLLYLTGDKNRDAIQTALSSADIVVEPHQVYETSARVNLTAEIRDVVVNLPPTTTDIWVAFFAPSSAAMALPALAEVLNLPTSPPAEKRPGLHSARFAAIGKTTSAYLQEEHATKFRVDAVAASPTAEELANAIDTCNLKPSLPYPNNTMAASKRNNKSEDKAPRRSSRPRQEPDRFFIPLDPPKPRKSSAAKKQVATGKSTRATQSRPKPKKQAKAPKQAGQPKPKATKKRAREDQDDEEDQSRPTKRARPVANPPKRTISTRARRVSPSPSPSASPSPGPIIKPEPEEERVSEAPTEVEPEFAGTGTLPDFNAIVGHLVNHGLLPPANQQMHQVPAVHAPAPAPPAPLPANPVQPHAPIPIPNPIFAPVAGPVAQPQAPLPPVNPGQPGLMQDALLGFDGQDEGQQQDWDQQVNVAVGHPLNRQDAFIQL
ncbi:hypothetical protein FRC04_006883 [Tulasnella sp. 424]|nr:hypothetical protein FRC04_006883 [Tulasnella sp. 424]KAG8974388.1 hypothetical protein FRC05_007549 [Tulasnella sp. 425]